MAESRRKSSNADWILVSSDRESRLNINILKYSLGFSHSRPNLMSSSAEGLRSPQPAGLSTRSSFRSTVSVLA